MTAERREIQIDEALARLRATTDVPPVDAESERALLAAFDAHWAQPRRVIRRTTWVWTAAAASMALALGLGRIVVNDTTSIDTSMPERASLADFVPWPGADALPPLESGELLRIDLPRAALPALGLSAPPSTAIVVAADIVIGQDGLARAVRLVQQR
jgi:hypothetical protein